jgi:hypothetical protein
LRESAVLFLLSSYRYGLSGRRRSIAAHEAALRWGTNSGAEANEFLVVPNVDNKNKTNIEVKSRLYILTPKRTLKNLD